MKNFNGKAIYQPAGKAGEYAKWACNFYVGCSNGCSYCYCKKGILAGVMGQDKPQLKKCFDDEVHALDVFEKELKTNLSELQENGLFFSFTTDPMLLNTIELTLKASIICLQNNIPVKILTKKADWAIHIIELFETGYSFKRPDLIAFGFTLTGHDELEPGASTNAERIEAMKKLHDAGFKTFASIEPVIDVHASISMIVKTKDFCDHYKIGLESGKKYQKYMIEWLIDSTLSFTSVRKIPVYFKDSLLKTFAINRADLPENCVDRDYNIFKD